MEYSEALNGIPMIIPIKTPAYPILIIKYNYCDWELS